MPLLKKQATKGNVIAQRLLGDTYYFGQGVPKNDKKAVHWTRKAAEQGVQVHNSILVTCSLLAKVPLKMIVGPTSGMY